MNIPPARTAVGADRPPGHPIDHATGGAVGRRGTSARATGSLVGQLLSSGTNFLTVVAALHVLDLRGVGAYMLAYTTLTLLLMTVRPLVLNPLLVRYTVADPAARLTASTHAAGSCLVIALALAVVTGGASIVWPGPFPPILWAMALVLPPILVQDAWRHHWFAAGRPWKAAANDGVCLLTTLAGVLLVAGPIGPSTSALLLAWGAGMLVGAVWGCVQLQSVPALRGGVGWLVAQRDLGVPLAGGMLVMQAIGRLTPVAVATIVGVAAVGRLYAALTVLLPVGVLFTATESFSLPEAARRMHAGGVRAMLTFVLAMTAVVGAAVAGFALVVNLLPDALGRLYADENWAAADSVLVPVSVYVVGVTLWAGARTGLQVLGRTMATLWVSLASGLLQMAGAVLGAVVGGIEGAAWGFGLASVAGVGLWWPALVHAARAAGTRRTGTPVVGPRLEQAPGSAAEVTLG